VLALFNGTSQEKELVKQSFWRDRKTGSDCVEQTTKLVSSACLSTVTGLEAHNVKQYRRISEDNPSAL